MRIIYVTAHLPHGTDEAFLIPEITGLQRLGHEVLVVPRSPHGPFVHGSILVNASKSEPLISHSVLRSALRSSAKVLRGLSTIKNSRSRSMAMRNAAVLPKAAWLAELAKEWRADHIHCHWGGTTATMAMLASEWSRIPWSLTLHRWDIVENNLLARKALSATLMRFISEDGLRMAQARGVPESDHLRVIHMGVDLPGTHSPRLDGNVVLCPARLVEVKGHKFLLEAWRKVLDHGVDAQLWLAGDGPLKGALEAQAVRLGIYKSVRFLGTVPHDRLLSIYREEGIAATVLASVDLGNGCHEGIPVALIEAMSFGIPVIGTRAGGTSELIRSGTGVMVGPGDAQELATAITALLQNRDEARAIGEFGRRHVSEEFNIENTVRQLEAAFKAACGRPQERIQALVSR